ncbi:MAG: choice-of-anchor C family protein [Minisyncoccia bacterium]
MKALKVVLAGASIAALAAAAPAFAAVSITNGSFETGTSPGSFLTVSSGGTDITGWNVDSGSVDYIGSYWQAADGTRSLDLNGTTTGSVSQALATDIGATYQVTFSLSGNPDNSTDPSFASPTTKVVTADATGASPQSYSYDTVAQGNSTSDMKWQTESYTFVATGTSTTLSFASQIPGASGPALDNVAITETATPPPPAATTKAQCMNSGWQTLTDIHGNHFKNQGDCVSYVATGGKNQGSGGH